MPPARRLALALHHGRGCHLYEEQQQGHGEGVQRGGRGERHGDELRRLQCPSGGGVPSRPAQRGGGDVAAPEPGLQPLG